MSLRGLLATLLRQRRVALSDSLLEHVLLRHQAQPWFLYAHKERAYRQHVCWPSFWLARQLHPDCRILETGCGCALNLLWFAQFGFRNLYGFDNDPTAVAAGREVNERLNCPIRLWVDDGLRPVNLPSFPFHAILALNWTYHVHQFDLTRFLSFYKALITPGGYLVLDSIDTSFSQVALNEFATSDWGKPIDERRPTEYPVRFSPAKLRSEAEALGYRIVAQRLFRDTGTMLPRRVNILTSI
jgi:SAM-dependent methyltransferase